MKKYEKPEIEITVFDCKDIIVMSLDRSEQYEGDVVLDEMTTVGGLQMAPGKGESSIPEPTDSQETEETSTPPADLDPLDNISGNEDQSSDSVDGNADTGVSETGQESSASAIDPPTGDTTVTETPAE